MMVKHTYCILHLHIKFLWMIKSTMPFHQNSPHHLRVYHNLASYQMMTMIEFKKYSGTHLCMCIRMNSQIKYLFQRINKTSQIYSAWNSEIEFKLGMNIIFKDGTSKHVVYKPLKTKKSTGKINCFYRYIILY